MSRIRKAHQAHRFRKVMLVVLPLAGLAAAAIVFLALFIAGTLLSYGQDLPKLRKGDLPRADQTTKIYAVDGRLLANLFAEQNRVVLPLSKIPANVRQAVIDIEDQRFWSHNGVDVKAIARAIRTNLASGAVLEGGSTIDQQYVRNVLITREKTLRRKIREAMLAYRLEQILSKKEILERYLNTVYFGESAYGVEAASVTYFGKHAARLTLPEAALLAGLIKSPNRLSPHANPDLAMARRNVVLRKMYRLGHVGRAQLLAAMATKVRVVPPRPPASPVPYFAEYVKQLLIDRYGPYAVFRGGLRVRTTINLKVQRMAESAWRSVLGRRTDPSVAIVAIDPRTGFIGAMVGGRSFATSKYNLATQAHRQPGSAFKPFVLATALEEGVSPNKEYDSAPALIHLPGGGTWNVDNATEGGGGDPMPLRDATVHSVNAVFARLIMDVGPEKVASTASDCGITTPINSNPAIALGGLRRGVTPLEMASAYGTFANGGVSQEPIAVVEVRDSSGALIDKSDPIGTLGVSAGTAWLVTDILKGVITDGTGTEAGIGRPAAGKTGTTQAYRDAWFVGYTPQLVTSVWVGYPNRERPMTNVRGIAVKGGTFPAMIWARFMRAALAGVRATDFAKPGRDLVRVKVCTESDLLATRYCPSVAVAQFARGSQPTKRCTLHGPPATATGSRPAGVVVVPNVTGMGQNQAVLRIRGAGLLASVRAVFGGVAATVQSQRPFAGTAATRGSVVTLFVATSAGTHGPADHAPTVKFSASPSSPHAGETIAFDAATSWDKDGDITSYRWTFGDGDSASGEVVSHAYRSSGSFTVMLTVTDRAGLAGSSARTVSVSR